MYFTTLLILLTGTAVASSLASPLEKSHIISSKSVSTFETAPKPTALTLHRRYQPSTFGRHRILGRVKRETLHLTEPLWSFGNNDPVPTDLSKEAAGVLDPSKIISSPAATSTLTVTTTFTSAAHTSTTDSTASQTSSKSQTSKLNYIIAAVVGTLTVGFVLLMAAFKIFSTVKPGRWGSGIESEKSKDDKKISWMRLSSAPANFGAGRLMQFGDMSKTAKRQTLYGRQYDERGIECGLPPKIVSFQDDRNLSNKSEFDGPMLPSLAYLVPTAHSSVVQDTSNSGMKAGQTFDANQFATAHILPSSHFDGEDHIISPYASPSASHVSFNLSPHPRISSAPIISLDGIRPWSNQASTASAEWDIAQEYAGPRYDKGQSAGAMSGLSVDPREWYDNIRRLSGRSSGTVATNHD